MWQRIESVLTQPELIAKEVERVAAQEPVAEDTAAVDRALVDIGRRQRGLVENLALLDPDAVDTPSRSAPTLCSPSLTGAP